MLYARGKKEKNVPPPEPVNEERTLTLGTNGKQPPENLGEVRSVKVTGRVRLVGTGIFNDLIISGEHQWYIAKDDREKLHNLQQQTVTVEGDEKIVELKLLNNLGSIYRRELSNIKIISIEQ